MHAREASRNLSANKQREMGNVYQDEGCSFRCYRARFRVFIFEHLCIRWERVRQSRVGRPPLRVGVLSALCGWQFRKQCPWARSRGTRGAQCDPAAERDAKTLLTKIDGEGCRTEGLLVPPAVSAI